MKDSTVAYHEAGHAVAAFWLHRPICKVTIIPDENSSGKVVRKPGPNTALSLLPGVERKAPPPCAGIFAVHRPSRAWGHIASVIVGSVATFALMELAKFLRSVLRLSEILLQNDAML